MLWLSRDGMLVWCLAPWKLPSLPLMWIPQNGIHNRLEFPRNSTGSWKSPSDFHSSHRADDWPSAPRSEKMRIGLGTPGVMIGDNQWRHDPEKSHLDQPCQVAQESMARFTGHTTAATITQSIALASSSAA